MKCFQHPEVDATALCQSCQKGLCHSCASRFTAVSCASCLGHHNGRIAVHHAGRLLLTLLVFAGGTAFFASQPHPDRVYPATMGAVFICMMWGWITISEHSPRSFVVVGSPGLWLLFAGIRLLLSGFVGLLAAPFGIVNAVVQLVRALRARGALRAADALAAGASRDLAVAKTARPESSSGARTS